MLFMFGVLIVALSAMQVALAGAADHFLQDSGSWMTFARVSRRFSIATMVSVVVVMLFLLVLLLSLLGRETVFALYHLSSRRKGKARNEEKGNQESSK